jgi:hypothetical protein
MTETSLTLSSQFEPPHGVARLPRVHEVAVLDACSICLRVRYEAHWIEPGIAIRALRTFEQASPPRLRPAICERCAAALAQQRSRAPIARAA